MFRTWILEPQLQDGCVLLYLCPGGHPTTAQGHPTRATSLETTPSLRQAAEREGTPLFLAAFPQPRRTRAFQPLRTVSSYLLMCRGPEEESDLPKVTQWQVPGPALQNV